MHSPFPQTYPSLPFSPRPAAESEVLEAHPVSGSSADPSGAPHRNTAASGRRGCVVGPSELLSPIRYEARCGHCARTIGGDGAAAAAEAIHLHDESHPFCETRGCPMRAAWPTETDDLPRWCNDHGPQPITVGCHVFCGPRVHVLTCVNGRGQQVRRDDAFQRRADYEESLRG